MDDLDDYYSSEAINARVAERKQQDFKDIQDELADRDNGKIKRFTTEEERAKRSGKTSEIQRQKQYEQITLAMMLETPEYAALYNDTMSALNDADTTVYETLIESSEQVAGALKALEEAEKSGARQEELERLRKELKEAQERHQKMLEHEKRLQEIRERMEDKDNPPSQEEIEGFKKEIGAIASAMKTHSATNELQVTEPESSTTPSSTLDLTGFTPS